MRACTLFLATVVAFLAGALLTTSPPAHAAAPAGGWEPPPYAEEFTASCLPREPRSVVRHDLQVLALARCPLPPQTLAYHRFDPSAAAAGAGQYAVLAPGGVATTYEQWRLDATRLRLHTADRTGHAQTGFYALVEPGDFVEWRVSDSCGGRYRVTAVRPPAAAAAPWEFGVTVNPYVRAVRNFYTDTRCPDAVAPNMPVRLRWSPPAGPTIHGTARLPARDQGTIAQVAADVHGYFTRWLGITPSQFEVQVEEGSPLFPCLSTSGPSGLTLYLPCPSLKPLVDANLARSYAAAAVYVARTRPDHTEPEWLIAGHAHYVYARWVAAAGPTGASAT